MLIFYYIMSSYPSQRSYDTINQSSLDQNVPYEETMSSDVIYIHTPSLQESMACDIQTSLHLDPIQSKNKDKVLQSIEQRSKKELSSLEREICIEEICFEQNREKHNEEHSNHKTIRLSELIQQLQILKCNYHFAQAEPGKVINLLDSLDDIYHQITRFQLEIVRLFNKIKIQANRHITQIKQSFSNTYFEQIKGKLGSRFDYANVKYALSEIEKFKAYKYSNLDYPNFKISNMKNRIAKSNVNNKVVGIESINCWIERLYALEKLDTKVIFNRSIATFLKKSPCEQRLFSYYLKSEDYITNGKRLQRNGQVNENVPIAVVEKELLPSTQINFKVVNIGKGIFIGFSPLGVIEKSGFENCIEREGSYFITHRGDLLPFELAKKNMTNIRLTFTTNDEISIRRQKNAVIWKRKREDKSQQELKIILSIKEYSQNLYVCVHLQDKNAILEILD